MPNLKQERIPDEILAFLGHPLFQIPVRQFMDENCLIFAEDIPVGGDHKSIHAKYKKLVDTLLDSFCHDAGISLDDAQKTISKMSSMDAIKEFDEYKLLFQQIEASVSFNVFCEVMESRNLTIQQQVLAMIFALSGGELPECMTPSDEKDRRNKRVPAESIAPVSDEQEEKILNQVYRSSLKEQKGNRGEEKLLKKTAEITQQEAHAVQENRRAVEQGLHNLALIDEPTERAKSASGQRRGVPPPPEYERAPAYTNTKQKTKSSSDAANDWLESAKSEASSSASAPSQANLVNDAALMKQRSDYLKQQRDKLLQMKKDAREKQLHLSEDSGPKRPRSSRAARSAISEPDQVTTKKDEDEQKKLQVKLSIAEKLRQEVVRGSHGSNY